MGEFEVYVEVAMLDESGLREDYMAPPITWRLREGDMEKIRRMARVAEEEEVSVSTDKMSFSQDGEEKSVTVSVGSFGKEPTIFFDAGVTVREGVAYRTISDRDVPVKDMEWMLSWARSQRKIINPLIIVSDGAEGMLACMDRGVKSCVSGYYLTHELEVDVVDAEEAKSSTIEAMSSVISSHGFKTDILSMNAFHI